MKAYLLTSGTIFALLALLHAWRVVAEWPLRGPEGWLAVATGILAVALSVWAFRLLRLAARP